MLFAATTFGEWGTPRAQRGLHACTTLHMHMICIQMAMYRVRPPLYDIVEINLIPWVTSEGGDVFAGAYVS